MTTTAAKTPALPTSPLTTGSKILGGTPPPAQVNRTVIDPITLNNQIANQHSSNTQQSNNEKLCHDLKSFAAKLAKEANFNPGMYGDRRDSNIEGGPATSGNYTSATTYPTRTKSRTEDPASTASTAFGQLNAYNNPADESTNIYGALFKTAFNKYLTSYENRGPTVNPYEQEQPQFISYPIGSGPMGKDAITKAFDQFKSEIDSASFE